MKNKTIYFADSCSGGLTVLLETLPSLEGESVFYIADGGNNPFGKKTRVEVERIVVIWLNFITQRHRNTSDVVLVIACNTASAAIENRRYALEKKYGIRIFTMLDGYKDLLEHISKKNMSANDKKINFLLMATALTLNSNEYRRLNEEYLSSSVNMSTLVITESERFIARALYDDKQALQNMKEELSSARKHNAQVVISGCTCCDYLHDYYCEIFGKQIEIISPAKYVAKKVSSYLQKVSYSQKAKSLNGTTLLFTGDETLWRGILLRSIEALTKVSSSPPKLVHIVLPQL